MFVLHVAKAAASVAGKEVGLDVNRFQLWNLNRSLNKDNRYIKLNGRDYTYTINPTMLLNDMRNWASELMDSKNFDFGRIYDAFYAQIAAPAFERKNRAHKWVESIKSIHQVLTGATAKRLAKVTGATLSVLGLVGVAGGIQQNRISLLGGLAVGAILLAAEFVCLRNLEKN